MSLTHVESEISDPQSESQLRLDKAKRHKESLEQDLHETARKWARTMAGNFLMFVDKEADAFHPYFILDESLHHSDFEHAASFHNLTHRYFLEELNINPEDVLESQDEEHLVLVIDDVELNARLQRFGDTHPEPNKLFAIQYAARHAADQASLVEL